jgi:hypothetical protein
MTAPTLPPGCGSWIVVRKGTLEAVYETWSRSVAEKVDAERYTVLTALDYLQRFNSSL